MKSTGIVRKIDNLGRLVLPKELRDQLDLPEGTPMEVFIDGESIILSKYAPGCIICGEIEGVTEFKGKKICKTCLKEIKK
jgi:transcriptional pleiotropic regulator of transition state genes